MKKQSGFTLIELVIVIIILGILAATAVPKFVDMQSDARASALKGVKGALESASTLIYSKAAIKGKETSSTKVAVSDVDTKFGYPQATATGIEKAVELSSGDWKFDHTTSGVTVITASGATETAECQVKYTAPTAAGSRPSIEAKVTKC